ncbi:MAG TPA: hypothetical protein DER58_01615 [Firmicutes bacterium]|jgi:hypothetical protein|nr:hypothetical protein [Bacillota bacterium]
MRTADIAGEPPDEHYFAKRYGENEGLNLDLNNEVLSSCPSTSILYTAGLIKKPKSPESRMGCVG